MTRGRFVTVEGIEGAGKSTLLQGLSDALRARSIVVCATREPGGTPLAEDIRSLVLARRTEGMPPAAELLLMFAARASHVAQRIEPALARGEWVLCDRFTDASRAYQGGGRGMDPASIESLARVAHPGLAPDLTLLLDLSPEAGLSRARQRGAGGDRFEDEALAFFTRVRAAYLALAAAEPRRFRVLDATLPPAQLLQQAEAQLRELLP
ncbi:MAG: dTMP kinase [Proteobacteria bacterium]|jgi:dTMP kinase|nr:dTMP kinase [Pseudomonadota bacterium]MBK7114455.1 dTMP kinase [Pseudomonadota bacterium]MBK9253186.1 dTMP kinase [Pseudomonadota bacterium]MCC6631915.1 dTMP kinase [Gammaproteobacteria bacterium]